MTRRFADFSRPAPAPWRWTDTILVALGSAIAVASFVALGLLFLLVHPAGARDLGQWEKENPYIGEWFRALKQPDNKFMSCCGEADAYWADQTETGPNGELIAVITDDRPDEPLGRRHVPVGTKFVIPPHKIKFDQGNPTGHIVIFISTSDEVWCYVQNGGV